MADCFSHNRHSNSITLVWSRADCFTRSVTPKTLTCDTRMEWFNIFRKYVASGEEVDLVNFNQDYDANICERIAARHGMTFRTDLENDTAFVRKPQRD